MSGVDEFQFRLDGAHVVLESGAKDRATDCEVQLFVRVAALEAERDALRERVGELEGVVAGCVRTMTDELDDIGQHWVGGGPGSLCRDAIAAARAALAQPEEEADHES